MHAGEYEKFKERKRWEGKQLALSLDQNKVLFIYWISKLMFFISANLNTFYQKMFLCPSDISR